MAATGPVGGQADPEALQIEAHRGYLMRYATLQLRDAAAAEDVVQDTLLAALKGGARYEGRASVRTWLTGILKHKIIDHLRRQAREQPLERPDALAQDPDAELADAVFAEDGHWSESPGKWSVPERSLESKQFWAVLESCIRIMPPRTARVFVMREVLELSTEEICKELGITATNCWVTLHRARLALRGCLETRWFSQ